MFVSLHVGPASASPEEAGPHDVGFFDVSFSNMWGNYDAMVYYPAGEYGYDAPLDNTDERYPALSFAPGVGNTHNSYSWFGEHMASWGFVVIIWTPPDINAAYHQRRDGHLEAIEVLNDLHRGGKLRGRVGMDSIGLAGHSYGATGTLLAVPEDNRVRAGVALAGYVGEHYQEMLNAAQRTSVPVQLQSGTGDTLCPASESEEYFDMLGTVPKEVIIIEGADHESFCCVEDEYNDVVKKYMTAWFLNYLSNDMQGELVCGETEQYDEETGVKSTHRSAHCGSDSSKADLNRDGTTDVQDLVLIAGDLQKTSGFFPGADINSDGIVDIFDLVLAVVEFL
jgi:predicted dienelactone hydrolase